MSDADNDKWQAGPLAGCLTVALLIAPPLYVLSVGPACWLGNNGYLPDELKYFYLPLALLAENCPPIKTALQWYIDLWL